LRSISRKDLGFVIEQRVHGGVVNYITGPTTTSAATPTLSIGATSATSGGWRPDELLAIFGDDDE
jgi:hypothetical protein